MRSWAVLALVVCASPAHAHIGAVVANAKFTQPAAPTTTPVDQGYVLAPLTLDSVTVGQPYTVSWTDGDNDPTGRFYFYYLDRLLPYAADATMVETLATLIPDGNGVWASCNCSSDAGVMCPDAGVRDCRNSITWDTTGVAAGTYWIYAVNNDPPYHVYSFGWTPVRIGAAGSPLPPAALVIRPDGYGAWSSSYRVQWYAVGTPPLKIDLAYGVNSLQTVLGPTTSLGKNVVGISNTDGTESWDWDISALANNVYFLRIIVTDGNGVQAHTDGHYGLTVYRANTDLAPTVIDLGSHDGFIPRDRGAGCGCSLAPASLPLASLVPLVFALAFFRRRR